MKGTLIQKEEITSLTFPHNEVLIDPTSINKRQKALEDAMQMGNNYKGKVQIVFDDAKGDTFLVETTVWSTTDNFISLKAEVMIPIHAIREVIMF